MPEFQLSFKQGLAEMELGLGVTTPYRAVFSESEIQGVGGYYSPQLRIPLKFEPFLQQANCEFIIACVWAELHLGLDTERKPDDLLSRIAVSPFTGKSPFTLDMPLSRPLVERMDDFRNGEDLNLYLYLQVEIGVQPSQEHVIRTIDIAAGGNGFTISRSKWIDKMLPGMGYLTRYLIEVPAPSTGILSARFRNALKDLKDAEKSFRNDHYDGTLVACRNVINAITSDESGFKFELEGKASYKNRAEAFGEQCLKPIVGRSKADMIVGEILALERVSSGPTKPGDFSTDRPLAKHILVSTANILAYLGKVFLE